MEGTCGDSDSPLLIGVDAGTTNTKAVVVDASGHVVAVASEPTPIAHPQPEWAEYDADTLWSGCVAAIRGALAQVDRPERIVGISIASMAETAVPLDAAGRATAPAVAWFDKRSRAELAQIVGRIGQERLFATSGLAPEPIFGLCKLLWLKNHRAEAYQRTVRWLNTADYIAWKLSGEMATDHSLACRTFALDLARLEWSDTILGEMEVDPSLMAPLAASGTRLGPITAAAAAESGLPPSCVVAVGGHDHVVGALAADAVRPGVLLNSTGTTEAVMMGIAQPGRDPALGRAGYSQGVIVVDEPVWFVVAGLFTAGAAIDWFRQAMAEGADHATLIAEAAAAPPGSLGAGFLPQLRLGTPPRPDGRARGAFFGLSTDVTRGCLFRALLEGLAADSRLCAEGMLALAPATPIEQVRVIGGLTRNAVYMRIKAAMMGRPVTLVDLPDSVAKGAALLAGIGAAVYGGLAEAVERTRGGESRIMPDSKDQVIYDRLLRDVYAHAYPALKPVHDAGQRALGLDGEDRRT
ncbi:MAG: L-fuculokinase [Alphaproteobacteria bacterium]